MAPSKNESLENIPMVMEARTEVNLKIPKRLKTYMNREKNGSYLCIIFLVLIALVLMAYGLIRSVFLFNEIDKIENMVCQKRVIGYYRGNNHRKITEKLIEKLTHIIFIGTKIDQNGTIFFESDENKLCFMDMRNKTKNKKLMFSTDFFSDNNDHVSSVLKEYTTRKIWIDSISSFILKHQLDGVELYYRWPKTKEEKDTYVHFVRELRSKLESVVQYQYIISVVAPSWDWPIGNETILQDLMDYVSFFNVETDNYFASHHTEGLTGPLSPLFSYRGNRKSIDNTMKNYVCKTLAPNRFNIMLPFRGCAWKNVTLFDNGTLYGAANGHRPYLGMEWWKMVADGWHLSSASWDDHSKTPYIWDSNRKLFYTFDTERSLKEKMNYIHLKNIGGVTIDRIEMDDDSNSLLNAVTSVDLCSGEEKDEVKYNCEGNLQQ